jgi:hypothetical protein
LESSKTAAIEEEKELKSKAAIRLNSMKRQLLASK